jgi:hypothetical protein
MINNPTLQKIYKGMPHTQEDKNSHESTHTKCH